MKTINKTFEALILATIAAPFVYMAVVWNRLPDQIISHYDLNGTPNGTQYKGTFAVLMAIVQVVVYITMRFTPGLSIFGNQQPGNYQKLRFGITLFVSVLTTWAIYGSLPGSIQVGLLLVWLSVMGLFAVLGNYMPSLRPNFFVGIRTPWTLFNETVWRKTHQMAGRLWVAGGLLGAVLLLVVPTAWHAGLTFTVLTILVLVPVVYSYMQFRDQKRLPLKTLLLGLFLLGAQVVQAQTAEPMSITTTEGVVLEGTLTLPKDAKRPVLVALLIAGSGPTDRNGNSGPQLQSNAYAMLADSLAQRGIAMLRYDKRVSGTNIKQAIGLIKPETNRFETYVADAHEFIRNLQADKRFSRVVVMGHSEGSLVGMLVAREVNATAFVSLAGPGRNIADVLKVQFQTAIPEAERAAAALVLDTLRMNKPANKVPMTLLMMGFGPINQPFLRSWMQYDPAMEITKFKGPVLIIQGKRDVQVAVSEAEQLHQARPDARYRLFDQMSHVLKDGPEDRMANIKTYTDPNLPLTPGLASEISNFILSVKSH